VTNLAKTLRYLYPDATPNVDFEVVDLSDGQGPRITAWNAALGAQPTDAQLTAGEAAMLADWVPSVCDADAVRFFVEKGQ
jgi:hypothetical protein